MVKAVQGQTPRDRSFPDGVLVVDKPQGPTSHDVVTLARRALGVSRIGHTGTLDPMATGVLPLVVGRATRLAQFLTAGDKDYDATVAFGRTTDTYDALGKVVTTSAERPTREQLDAALARFRGTVRADATRLLGEEHRRRAIVRAGAQDEGRRDGAAAQGRHRHRAAARHRVVRRRDGVPADARDRRVLRALAGARSRGRARHGRGAGRAAPDQVRRVRPGGRRAAGGCAPVEPRGAGRPPAAV